MISVKIKYARYACIVIWVKNLLVYFLKLNKQSRLRLNKQSRVVLEKITLPNPFQAQGKGKGYGAFDGLMLDILQKTLYKDLKQCYKIATLIK